jgi:hypothetical protein
MIYDFPEHICGDTWTGINSLTIMQNDDFLNLSGCNISMQFRSKNNLASPAVLDLTSENNDIVIVEPLSGLISFKPQIIDIPVDTYNYDLEITFSDGSVFTYLKGTIKILPNITR